jgi:hypothetical protein
VRQLFTELKISSGCTALLYSVMAQFTRTGYFCALVDTSDAFDAKDAEVTGVELSRVLWVRCQQSKAVQKVKGVRHLHKTITNQFQIANRFNVTLGNCEESIGRAKTSTEGRKAAVTTNSRPVKVNSNEYIVAASVSVKDDSNQDRCAAKQNTATADRSCSGMATEACAKKDDDRVLHRRSAAKDKRCADLNTTATKGRCAGRHEYDMGQQHHHEYNTRQRHKISDCGRQHLLSPLEQAFKAADVLIQNGGFGLIAVDLSHIDEGRLRKVPLTTWFRFARVAKRTQTALIFLMSYPAANICADTTLQMSVDAACWSRPMKEAAEHSDLVRTNEREMGANSIKHVPEVMSSEQQQYFASKGRLLPSAIRLGDGLWNAAGVPLQKEESSLNPKDPDQKSKKRLISSHAYLFEGAKFEVEIRPGKKPVQPVKPSFTAVSMWK